jgi:phosphoglycolate phosphatase-like HAD superfamily hydrolase
MGRTSSGQRVSATGRTFPSAVVFDIDGTLAGGSSTHLLAFASAAAAELTIEVRVDMEGEVPYLNGKRVAGFIDAQCFRFLARSVLRSNSAIELALESFLDAYADEYETLLSGGTTAGLLLPGAETVLHDLIAADVPIRLATGNASRIARAKLTTLGVGQLFRFDASLGFGDRHRDRTVVVKAATADLVDRSSAVMVGDSTADVRAASLNGLLGIGVSTGASDGSELRHAGATAVIDSMEELPSVLEFLKRPHRS